ncbi:MAG: Transcriptional regulator, PadR family [Candidatus Rifleibacterium amylolyticum]|nr:MAG: Transcriptional regulator, PadR family [Candidatus Rifleibacterium amylolyticum]
MIPNLQREILLSFFKVHILHHASEEPVYGQSIMQELRRHGYEVSPGTLYPILKRMEARGWLVASDSDRTSSKDRLEYTLSAEGRKVLADLRTKVAELYEEVCLNK